MKKLLTFLALSTLGCGSPDTVVNTAPNSFLARVRVDDQRDGNPDLVLTYRLSADGSIERAYDFQGDGTVEMVIKADDGSGGGVPLSDPSLSLVLVDRNGDELPDDATLVSSDSRGNPTEVRLDTDGNGQVDEAIKIEYDSRGLPSRRAYDDNLDGQVDREVGFDFGDGILLQHLAERSPRQLLLLLTGSLNTV